METHPLDFLNPHEMPKPDEYGYGFSEAEQVDGFDLFEEIANAIKPTTK